MAAVAAVREPQGIVKSSSHGGGGSSSNRNETLSFHRPPPTASPSRRRTKSNTRRNAEAPSSGNSIALPTREQGEPADTPSSPQDGKPRVRKLSLPARIRRRESWKQALSLGSEGSAGEAVEPVPAVPRLPSPGQAQPFSSSAVAQAAAARDENSAEYRGPVTNDANYLESHKMLRRRSLFRKREKAPPLPSSASMPVLAPSLTLSSTRTSDDPFSSRPFHAGPSRPAPVSASDLGEHGKHAFSPTSSSNVHENDDIQIASPRRRQDAHQNARLSTKEASYLFDVCATEIKMRGLAVVGIFRPFRLAEKPREVERLIELYLLRCRPEEYGGIFVIDTSILSPFLEEALGKKNPETEFKRKLAYANVHDVVALFKWGLRRVNIHPNEIGATVENPLAWYENFARDESLNGYPQRAFSDYLGPTMSSYAFRIFKTVLDLMSTISAHHIANAMPAWRICRIIGYWLVGRVATEKATTDVKTALKRYKRAGLIMEHLLLAYIREQAAEFHFMPLRLTELIEGYPSVHLQNGRYPGLSHPHIAPSSKALCVESNTLNIVRTPKQPRRAPREVLAASLQARASSIESSEDVDDWVAIRAAVETSRDASKSTEMLETIFSENGDTVDDELANSNLVGYSDEELEKMEQKLVAEEDARILSIVGAELAAHRKVFDSASEDMSPTADASQDAKRLSAVPRSKSFTYDSSGSRFSNGSMDPSSSSHGLAHQRSHTNGNGQAHLSILSEDDIEANKPVDWNAFRSSGFATSMPRLDSLQLDQSLRPRTELERAFEEGSKQRSNGKPGKSRFGSLRRKRAMSHSESDPSAKPKTTESRGTPKYVLKSVKTIPFEETFAMIWLDQLLDDCPAARLPNIVCVQLSQGISNKLLGPSARQGASGASWLLLAETIVPPMPPPPPPVQRNTDRKSLLRRASFLGSASDALPLSPSASRDAALDDDRLSLTSVRSSFSARIKASKSIIAMKTLFGRGDDSTSNDVTELSPKTRRSRTSSFANGEYEVRLWRGGSQTQSSPTKEHGNGHQPTPIESPKKPLDPTNGRVPSSLHSSCETSPVKPDQIISRASAERRRIEVEQHKAFVKAFQPKPANGYAGAAEPTTTADLGENIGATPADIVRVRQKAAFQHPEVPRRRNASSLSKNPDRKTSTPRSIPASLADASISNHSHLASSGSSALSRYVDARESSE